MLFCIKNQPAALMQKLRFYLSYLPMQNERKPPFDELEKLFKIKRWISYYCVALTQIEGLFSEMYWILNPASETNKKIFARQNSICACILWNERYLFWLQVYSLYISDNTLQRLRTNWSPLLINFFHLSYKQQYRIFYTQQDMWIILSDYLFALE